MLRNFKSPLLLLTLCGSLLAVGAQSKPKPIYDVTGSWAGGSKQGHDRAKLSAQFTATDTSHSTFTGKINSYSSGGASTIDFTGTVSPSGVLKASGQAEGGGGTGTIQATINTKKNTMKGTFKGSGPHGNHGTFQLTRQ